MSAELLAELARMKVLFQQRAIVAAMQWPPDRVKALTEDCRKRGVVK